MFAFFDKIIGFLEMLWDFFVNLVEGLITALAAIANIATLPALLALYMPTIITTGVIICISFAVIKFIIGR